MNTEQTSENIFMYKKDIVVFANLKIHLIFGN